MYPLSIREAGRHTILVHPEERLARITDHSFSYFLFPFLFDESSYAERVAAVVTVAWPDGAKAKSVWSDAPDLPLEAVLCHVRQYLAPAAADPVFRLWKLDDQWYRTYGVGREGRWFLETGVRKDGEPRKPERSIRFELGAAGKREFAFLLALARSGVGVLAVNARPTADSPEEWLDFLHLFRFIGGQRGVRLRCERDVFDGSTRTKKAEAYFPAGGSGVGAGVLRDVVKLLLETAKLKSETETWWREAFVDDQLLPYSGTLVVEGAEEGWDELLYRLRNTLPGTRTIAPGEADLLVAEPHVLRYARHQGFFFSMDGIGFAALDPPDTVFFRETLPTHLQGEYFFVVLMCLLQRFTLLRLSELVANAAGGQGATSAEVTDAFERARRLLHEFAGNLYFSQVMHSEHHHRAYRACQKAWLVGEMYQEVRDEIREIHDFHTMRQAIALQRKVNWAVVLLAVPALFLSFLGVNWKGFTTGEGLSIQAHWEPLFGAALAFAALGVILLSVLRKQD